MFYTTVCQWENKKYIFVCDILSQLDTDKQVRWFLSFKPGRRLTDLTDTRGTLKVTLRQTHSLYYNSFKLCVNRHLWSASSVSSSITINHVMLIKFTNAAEAPVNKAARWAFMMAVLLTLFTISDWYLLLKFFNLKLILAYVFEINLSRAKAAWSAGISKSTRYCNTTGLKVK